MHTLITSLPHFFCSWVCVEGCGRRHHHYCQRKQKNRKNGVGLGTRLVGAHVVHTCQVNLDEHKALLHEPASLTMLGRERTSEASSQSIALIILVRPSYRTESDVGSNPSSFTCTQLNIIFHPPIHPPSSNFLCDLFGPPCDIY